MRKCRVCHGVSGDGQGPAAEYLQPKPRDYRKGVFKFTSTLYGIKPVRADLVRVIRKGAKGTSMPAFPFLSDEDVEAIIDYVLVLAHRGELERSLLIEAESEGEIDPEYVPDIVAEVLARWSEAQDNYITPLTQEPLFTEESIALGKRAFFSRDCVKCHGPDGSGKTRDNVGVDTWGNKTRAANLTAGMFHGGHRPIDIYRRIATGINGTPMPQFLDALREELDTIWHLVHFVMTFSDRQDRQTQDKQASSDSSKGSPQIPVVPSGEDGEDGEDSPAP